MCSACLLPLSTLYKLCTCTIIYPKFSRLGSKLVQSFCKNNTLLEQASDGIPRHILGQIFEDKAFMLMYIYLIFVHSMYVCIVCVYTHTHTHTHTHTIYTGHNVPSVQVGEIRQEIVEERVEQPEPSDTMEVDQTSTGNPAATSSGNPAPSTESHDSEPEPEWVGHLRAVDNILSGEKTVALHQEFLIRNNHTDLQILKNTKVCKLDYKVWLHVVGIESKSIV